MSKSKIEWCDRVWNPVTGCTRVSPGCDNCYAIRQSHRFTGVNGSKFEGVTALYSLQDKAKRLPQSDWEKKVDWTGKVRCHEDLLDMPRRWTKPSRVFVNSMSDLFHDDVPEEFIAKMWYRMAVTDKHVYMILTKRPLKMKVILNSELFKLRLSQANIDFPLKNVWLGVSCENQAMADQRIPHLLKTPAAVRFVSYEPALGPIDFRKEWIGMAASGFGIADDGVFRTKFDHLDWIITGGESGPGARPMHPDWARSVRDQCKAAGVAFFFKQHGEWLHESQFPDSGFTMDYFNEKCRSDGFAKVGKTVAKRLLDGVEHSEWPEAPNA